MKIEKVYRDSHGTVWMYATCDVKRRRSHQKKNMLWVAGFIITMILSMSAIIGGGVGAANQNYIEPKSNSDVHLLRTKEPINEVNRLDLSAAARPIVEKIEMTCQILQPDESVDEDPWFIKELPLSESLQKVVFEYSNMYGVDYYTMLGLIQVESNFRSDAVSRVGSYGLCQLNPKYFPSGLSDSENIRMGTEYLGKLIEKYQGDDMAALTAYNAGSDTGNREYATSVMNARNNIIAMTNTTEEVPDEPSVEECIGQENFTIGSSTFTSLPLPNEYYGDIDFSSFQPYEDYSFITNKNSAAYWITRSDRAYNDENGLRRYSLDDNQFSIDGRDDYVIALGTFYKPKGTCGQRYLIVTSTGYYTAIAGDEKSDSHTDDMHMFTLHSNGQIAGIIEWLVDTKTLNTSMKRSGNIATQNGPVEELKGDILYIYLIEE